MELNFSTIIIIAIIASVVISSVIALLLRRSNDYKVGVGCSLMFILVIVIGLGIDIVKPDVIIINEQDEKFVHETKHYIGEFPTRYDNPTKLKWCNKYIYNKTSEDLLLYPVYYGDEDAIIEDETEPIFIPAHSVKEIDNTPDMYFIPPLGQIKSRSNNSSYDILYVLDTVKSVINQEK